MWRNLDTFPKIIIVSTMIRERCASWYGNVKCSRRIIWTLYNFERSERSKYKDSHLQLRNAEVRNVVNSQLYWFSLSCYFCESRIFYITYDVCEGNSSSCYFIICQLLHSFYYFSKKSWNSYVRMGEVWYSRTVINVIIIIIIEYRLLRVFELIFYFFYLSKILWHATNIKTK